MCPFGVWCIWGMYFSYTHTAALRTISGHPQTTLAAPAYLRPAEAGWNSVDLWTQERQRLEENQINPFLHKICNELQHLAGTMLSTERAEAAQAGQALPSPAHPGRRG